MNILLNKNIIIYLILLIIIIGITYYFYIVIHKLIVRINKIESNIEKIINEKIELKAGSNIKKNTLPMNNPKTNAKLNLNINDNKNQLNNNISNQNNNAFNTKSPIFNHSYVDDIPHVDDTSQEYKTISQLESNRVSKNELNIVKGKGIVEELNPYEESDPVEGSDQEEQQEEESDPVEGSDQEEQPGEESDPVEGSDQEEESDQDNSNSYKSICIDDITMNYNVKQLKEILIKYKLPVSGNKQTLIDRINDYKKNK